MIPIVSIDSSRSSAAWQIGEIDFLHAFPKIQVDIFIGQKIITL